MHPRTSTTHRARHLLALGASLVVAGTVTVIGPTAVAAAGAASEREAATATGASGLTIEVAPAHDIDPAGEDLTVTVSGVPDGEQGVRVTYGLLPTEAPVPAADDANDADEPTVAPGDTVPADGAPAEPVVAAEVVVPASAIGDDGSATVMLPGVAAVVTGPDGTAHDLSSGGGVVAAAPEGDDDGVWDVAVPVSFAAPAPTGPNDDAAATPTTGPAPSRPVERGAAREAEAPTAADASGSRTGTGASGQTLTVTPVDNLDPAGETVTITGTGFNTAGFDTATDGIYVGFCVDNGPGAQPTPCVGGVDMEGSSGSSQWVTNNPIDGAPAVPIAADGSFTAQITVQAADEFVDCLALAGGKRCVVLSRVDHRRSADRRQDVKVPVCFEGEAACATDPVPPGPVDPPPTNPTPTQTPTDVTPSGTRTGTGPNGQTLTATPVDNLDPAGTEVEIVGRGFTEAAGLDIENGGLYVSFCVDNGAGAQPTPCVGGVDMEGVSGSSQWVTNNPIGDAPAVPIAADGSFTTRITVSARDEFVDCLARTDGKRCVIVARADHRKTADRSQDVKVPVCFAGEAACAADPIDPTSTAGDPPGFTGYPLAASPSPTTARPSGLAATGATSTRLVPAGLLAVALGVALVLLSRRSSPEPRS